MFAIARKVFIPLEIGVGCEGKPAHRCGRMAYPREYDRFREGKNRIFVIAIRGLVGIILWLSCGVWLVKEIRRDGVSPCGGGGENTSRPFEVKPLLLAAEPLRLSNRCERITK